MYSTLSSAQMIPPRQFKDGEGEYLAGFFPKAVVRHVMRMRSPDKMNILYNRTRGFPEEHVRLSGKAHTKHEMNWGILWAVSYDNIV